MAWLVVGLVLFLGAHSLRIFATGMREELIKRLGPGPWRGIYSLLSLAGICLIILGYSKARGASPLYYLPLALNYVGFAIVWLAFICVVAAYWPGNHIKRWLGDPMVFGVGLWALGHVLVNATPAALALFGGFLIWAVADYASLRSRARSIITNASAPVMLNTMLVVIVGSILAGAFALWVHKLLIGVAPLG